MSKDDKPQWSPVPLAICEACSLIWAMFVLGGAVWLIAFHDWHPATLFFAVGVMSLWTCKWCRYPGTDE